MVIFRDLVLRGCSQRIGGDAFVLLSHDVKARVVSGAPHASTEVICRVIDLARQVVEAAIGGQAAICAVEGFAASLQDG